MEMNVRLAQTGMGQVEQANVPSEMAETGVKKPLKQILDGPSVVVTQQSDFSKLLTEIQNKMDEHKTAVAKLKLSQELERLTGIAKGLTESQAAAMVALQIATEALERLTQLYTTTKEERRRMIEKKERLEDDSNKLQSKLETLDKQIAEMQIMGTTDEEQLAKLQAERSAVAKELSGVQAELSNLTDAIDAIDVKISNQEIAMEKAHEAVRAATKKLDSQCLSILETAISLTASQAMGVANGLEKEETQNVEDALLQSVAGVLLKHFEEMLEEQRDEFEKRRAQMV